MPIRAADKHIETYDISTYPRMVDFPLPRYVQYKTLFADINNISLDLLKYYRLVTYACPDPVTGDRIRFVYTKLNVNDDDPTEEVTYCTVSDYRGVTLILYASRDHIACNNYTRAGMVYIAGRPIVIDSQSSVYIADTSELGILTRINNDPYECGQWLSSERTTIEDVCRIVDNNEQLRTWINNNDNTLVSRHLCDNITESRVVIVHECRDKEGRGFVDITYE